MKINKVVCVVVAGLSINAYGRGVSCFRHLFTSSPKVGALVAVTALSLGDKRKTTTSQADAENRWQKFSIVMGPTEKSVLKEYIKGWLFHSRKGSWDIRTGFAPARYYFSEGHPDLVVEEPQLAVANYELPVTINMAKCKLHYKGYGKDLTIDCGSLRYTLGDVYSIFEVNKKREKVNVSTQLEARSAQ